MAKDFVYYTPGRADLFHPYQLLAAGRSVVTPGDGFVGKRFHQHVFILTLEGTGLLREMDTAHEAQPGTMAWLDTSRPYAHGCHPSHHVWRYLWFAASGLNLDYLYRQYPRVTVPTATSRPRAVHIFEDSIRLLSDNELTIAAEAAVLVARAIALLASLNRVPVEHTAHGSRMNAAMEAVRGRISEAWTVEKLSRVTGMSVSNLHKVFKRINGMTPMEWVRLERINTAKHVLASTDLKIAEVGRQCGYPDPYHFSREFARVVGLPPSGFRKTMRA